MRPCRPAECGSNRRGPGRQQSGGPIRRPGVRPPSQALVQRRSRSWRRPAKPSSAAGSASATWRTVSHVTSLVLVSGRAGIAWLWTQNNKSFEYRFLRVGRGQSAASPRDLSGLHPAGWDALHRGDHHLMSDGDHGRRPARTPRDDGRGRESGSFYWPGGTCGVVGPSNSPVDFAQILPSRGDQGLAVSLLDQHGKGIPGFFAGFRVRGQDEVDRPGDDIGGGNGRGIVPLRHASQVGVPDLSNAQVRHRIRPAKHAGIRTEASQSAGALAAAQGGGTRLPVGPQAATAGASA